MLVWSDVHGRKEMFKKFLEYKPEEEKCIAGDLVDSRYFGVTYQDQIDCIQLLLDYNCEYVWGNHDCNYLHGYPSKFWSSDRKRDVPELENAINNLVEVRPYVALVRDDFLITHAGVSPELALYEDIQEECDYLNKEWKDFLESRIEKADTLAAHIKQYSKIFDIGYSRGGWSSNGGLLWNDWEWDKRSDKYNLICGHTCHDEIETDILVTNKMKMVFHVCVDNRVGRCFNTKTEKVETFI